MFEQSIIKLNKWPKRLKPLTKEEEDARNWFMKFWHEARPEKFNFQEKFNHHFVLQSKEKKGERILEIGAGLGAHINYEEPDWKEYCCIELRAEMAAIIKERFPHVKVLVSDCQDNLQFEDSYFDRVVAIHVLEHLPNLPCALLQVCRVLKPDGVFSVCIPCEGGLAYRLGRNVSAKRLFKKRFPNFDYEKVVVANEHFNLPGEIIEELKTFFDIVIKKFFPLMLPSVHCNFIIGVKLKPKLKRQMNQLDKNLSGFETK